MLNYNLSPWCAVLSRTTCRLQDLPPHYVRQHCFPISRPSLLSAETAYYQQNSSCLPAELPALHQQNTLVFISNHVAASRIISCILCSSVGFIKASRANFTHISPLLGLPTFSSVTLSLQLTIRLLSPYNLCGLLQSSQNSAYSLLCPELHPGALQQYPPKR